MGQARPVRHSSKRGSRASGRQMALRADWRTGPRTPAWDALWKQILADIALSEEDTGPLATGANEEDREEDQAYGGGRDGHSTGS